MSAKPNVLLIAIDDLRPELHCYDRGHMHTPNIDRLAKRGVQFDRAYCQVPVCGASRASFFTGLRPTPERFRNHYTRIDEDAPEALALHEHLTQNGYVTVAHGKVLHHKNDRAAGWTSPPPARPEAFPDYQNPENVDLQKQRKALGDAGKPGPRGPAWEVGDCGEDAYLDAGVANDALADLDRLAAGDQPFFLAAGFIRPHLPFIAPKKYWDLYDPADIELPDLSPPTDCPSQAMHNFGELRNYHGIPDEGPLDEQTIRSLIHGYRATVSFLDALVGRLLDGLDRSGAADNTIVVFCVDHGWNLGEHGLWCKHCLFETSLRVPLLIAGPGSATGRSRGVAENLGIYPTLCDLLDLPTPPHVVGQSLLPQLKDPDAPGGVALSRWSNGESVRTDRHRYSEFRRDGQVVARMLFDHAEDPGEMHNLADDPAHAETVQSLAALLPPIDAEARA
ncbi:MAG: sulfatase [Phycisphaeraceae bacterium]